MRTVFVIISLFFITNIFAQHKTKNVILLSMDGYRWKELFGGADSALLFNKKYTSQDSSWLMQKYWAADATKRREKLMPFVWSEIAKHGQIYGNRDLGNLVNVKNKYWFSYPGRSETFTGYYDSLVNSNEYPDNPNENVLEFINKQNGYNGKVVTFASWDAVARIINRNRNGMLVNIYGEDVKGPNLTPLQKELNLMQHNMPEVFGQGERLDVMTYEMTKAYLMASHPRVVYIDFGDNDEFAHGSKYDMYLDAAHKADAMIAQLWDYLQQDDFYKDQTTILIFPDHGRGYGDEWTSHGSKIAHANETYLIAIGPDTPALGEVKTKEQIYQDQFAQTIASLLGFHFTANHPVGEPVKTVMAQ
ncbi:phosphoglyceromutase [Ilyomonas limi]|uniref:Phosphoglyceromutase n=1 Tax=Ilyomonas limi TaxID=2575867 RepID=A0A4U3KVS8_9BACT|nr:sulfatase-like hydrolase/transferase [Ilyomonas limi]TKK65127.1 phosphoglyceromutase [Ilyomonas limi]